MGSKQEILFSIKCQCSVYKNGLLITNKKKSKLSNLTLNSTLKIISIVPVNSKDQQIIFELKKLKNIHRKFIEQGKITLQFNEEMQKSNNHQDDNKLERLSQIFIDAASSQNLQLLIKKIVDLKKSIKNNKKKDTNQITIKTQSNNNQVKNNIKQTKSQSQVIQLISRKKDTAKNNQNLFQENQKQIKISRKSLMSLVYKPVDQDSQTLFEINKKVKKQLDILELPTILLQKIFQFAKVTLRHRLINKKFDDFVLKNIQTLHFRDQVDQETFNKLSKFALNVSGRLKKVRNLTLMDKYDDSELQKNRSKSLYFGQWKQMPKKAIFQIKCLKIHTLQIPYQIKFQFQNIYGIRLRQLHLYCKTQITTQNFYIKDENIIYLFKKIQTIQAFSIPYINSSVLDEISKMKDRALQIKSLELGSVNQNKKDTTNWYLFHTYENLKKLKVERVLQRGLLRKDLRYKFTFPMFIEDLEIGSILNVEVVRVLPTTLRRLKLIGDQYLNDDVENMFLPYLRYLDLTECQLVRPSLIDSLGVGSNLKIITNWQKLDIEFWKQMAKQKQIQIITLKDLLIIK